MRSNLAEKITNSTQQPKKKEEDEPYYRLMMVTDRCILRLVVHGDHTTFAFVFKWLGMQKQLKLQYSNMLVSHDYHRSCVFQVTWKATK